MVFTKFLDPKCNFTFKRIFGTEKKQEHSYKAGMSIDIIAEITGLSLDEVKKLLEESAI